MLIFDRIAAHRIAVSAAGALVFSGLCIGGAAAPAHAATTAPTTLSAWQVDAANRLDRVMTTLPVNARRSAKANARIGAEVAADGTLSAPYIVQSSGNRIADAALLNKARTLRLAPLPAAATNRSVILNVAFVEGDWAPLPRTAVRYAAR
ncbi:hypothetical protein [Sphingomonas montana]|uniref:hypothetical protein n=1 Tax=Sphingomonas montana TaxID=1843236 RepID=UPI00096D236E|nr:hypothetical protein [Sphingomonas montana]